jgi:hypothetical protein
MLKQTSCLSLAFVLLLSPLCIPQILAKENPFSIGIRVGSFTPLDAQIKGNRIIYFDSTGAQEGVIVSGFGTGPEVNLILNYDISNWGLMLDGGFRLLQKNKIGLNHTNGRDEYENRLNIFPITLSAVYRVNIADARTIPYLGLGLGLYTAQWETKHGMWRDEVFSRTWQKGSAKPLGVNFLDGFNAYVYRDIYFNGELRYSLIEGTWKITDQDTKEQIEYQSLNIGGVSINLGLGYSF